jgi:hypothetical protein
MSARSANDSHSLRLRAARLEQQLNRRHRLIRRRVAGIKQAVNARLTAPGMLLAAFGAGVLLEQTSDRRNHSFTRILNSAYAVVRLLATLSLTARIGHPDHPQSRPENVRSS